MPRQLTDRQKQLILEFDEYVTFVGTVLGHLRARVVSIFVCVYNVLLLLTGLNTIKLRQLDHRRKHPAGLQLRPRDLLRLHRNHRIVSQIPMMAKREKRRRIMKKKPSILRLATRPSRRRIPTHEQNRQPLVGATQTSSKEGREQSSVVRRGITVAPPLKCSRALA